MILLTQYDKPDSIIRNGHGESKYVDWINEEVKRIQQTGTQAYVHYNEQGLVCLARDNYSTEEKSDRNYRMLKGPLKLRRKTR